MIGLFGCLIAMWWILLLGYKTSCNGKFKSYKILELRETSKAISMVECL